MRAASAARGGMLPPRATAVQINNPGRSTMIRNAIMLSAALALSPVLAQTAVKDAVGTAEAVRITARITAIDPATRTVTVVGPKGKSVSLVAGDKVRNFAQIKVGDEVVLRYMEAVTVALEKSAVGRSETQTTSGPMAAAPGAKPAVGETTTTTIVANVQSVDTAAQSVVLEGPNGKYVEVKVKDPAVFKQVKANDKVKVTYTEAVLLDVETPKK
jgi:hypothetical protein